MSTSAYRMETNDETYIKHQEGVILNFEEYRIKREAEKKEKSAKIKKGISLWGAIIAGIGGFLAAVGTVALTGLVEEKAIFVLYVLWSFFGGALGCWFDEVGV